MKTIRFSVAGLSVVAAVASAQAVDPAGSTHGTLSILPDVQLGRAMPAGAQRTAALAAADRVVGVLRRSDALANPVGYAITLRRLTSARLDADAPGIPFHSAVLASLTYYATGSDGHVSLNGGSFQFHFAINTIGSEAEIESTEPEGDHGPRVLRYSVTGQFRGRPVYDGMCTYISHRPVPPVVPVTRERFLRLQLIRMRSEQARHEGQRQEMSGTPTSDALQKFLRDRPTREKAMNDAVAGVRQMGGDSAQVRQLTDAFRKAEAQQEAAIRATSSGGADGRMKQIVDEARGGEAARIAEVQAQLDALSPAERQRPAGAVPLGRGEYKLADVGDPDAESLIQQNPAFYDASLAPDVPQVIWVCLPGLQGLEDKSYENYAGTSRDRERQRLEQKARDAARIRDGIDWAALEAMVKP